MICIIMPGGSGEHVGDIRNSSISLKKPGGSGKHIRCWLNDRIVGVDKFAGR